MELLEIEHRLQRLLERFAGNVPPEQIEDAKDLVKAGEPGVALENYCSQLFEFDAAVPAEVLAELEALGRAMGIDQEYCLRLRRM